MTERCKLDTNAGQVKKDWATWFLGWAAATTPISAAVTLGWAAISAAATTKLASPTFPAGAKHTFAVACCMGNLELSENWFSIQVFSNFPDYMMDFFYCKCRFVTFARRWCLRELWMRSRTPLFGLDIFQGYKAD